MKTNINAGLSGCKIEIINEITIRKYSANHLYNNRLATQIEKQKVLWNKNFTSFNVPKVYNMYTEDIFYVDMEYILSESYDSYFSLISVHQFQKIKSFFDEYFDNLIKEKDTYDSQEIKEKLLLKLNSFTNSNYKDLIDTLKNKVETTNYFKVPKSFCHGDLSLTNILFTNDKLYLIDFLDSYIDSYLIDFVKLKQDLHYKWALQNQKQNDMKLYQTCTELWNYIDSKFANQVNCDIFKILDYINWLRIEPYLKNMEQKTLLNKIICNI